MQMPVSEIRHAFLLAETTLLDKRRELNLISTMLCCMTYQVPLFYLYNEISVCASGMPPQVGTKSNFMNCLISMVNGF